MNVAVSVTRFVGFVGKLWCLFIWARLESRSGLEMLQKRHRDYSTVDLFGVGAVRKGLTAVSL